MGDWSETFVLGPYYELYENSVAYNGALHWLAEPSAIIAYDFDDKVRYRLVSCPITRTMVEYPLCSQCLGVCCGVLRILELAAFPDSDGDSLTLWELEDYPDGNWNVECRIRYKELVAAGDPRVQIEERGKHQGRLRALGIHPTDRDVVFLQTYEHVVSCNLETRELKTEATTNHLVHMPAAFPVDLQWWPTPIPTLP
ncbi:uncharacterized protein LOC111281206 [Durio zibethinus]|uniref:Uncharacterized protein LOC111281206 n=1 Tax=Durio zibethinus TaxID=66656 RepID=A0A6P5X873_DURZI|nr:uncharacterized protein LOC111281206 [Durio zibethinus]